MKRVIWSILLVLVFSVSNSYAQTQTPNAPVEFLGAQNNGQAYFNFSGADSSCTWSLYFFDVTTSSGKAMFAALLISKISGLNLTRIDYVNNGGICTVSTVQL